MAPVANARLSIDNQVTFSSLNVIEMWTQEISHVFSQVGGNNDITDIYLGLFLTHVHTIQSGTQGRGFLKLVVVQAVRIRGDVYEYLCENGQLET